MCQASCCPSTQRGDVPASCRSQRKAKQAGFTLIEVIIAFSLLALALTLLLGALSGATRQIRRSDMAGRAALHAQTLMAQIEGDALLRPGVTEGAFDEGRYRWNLVVEPWTDPLLPSVGSYDSSATRLLELRLTVEWGSGTADEMQWRSLRLVSQQNTAGMQQ